MSKYKLIVKADANDGDYNISSNEITLEEVELIKPVIQQLKIRRDKLNENLRKNWNKWSHNWETSEYGSIGTPKEMYVKTGLLTQEQVDKFDWYVPYGEYGVHTIESIELLEIVSEEKLF